MPPLKSATTRKSTVSLNTENIAVKAMNTRSSKGSLTITSKKENLKEAGPFPKRKAVSPIKGNTLKRSALGNITNAIETQCVITSGKKNAKKTISSTVTKPTIATTAKITHTAVSAKPLTVNLPKLKQTSSPVQNDPKSMLPPLPKSRLKPVYSSICKPVKTVATATSNTTTSVKNQSIASVKTVVPTRVPIKPVAAPRPTTRQSPSALSKKAAPSAVTASKCKVTVKPKGLVSNVPNTRRSSGRRSTLDSEASSLYVSALSDVLDEETSFDESLPKPEINIDDEYASDPFQCATYAYEIFEYLKSRESHFQTKDYMEMQTSLSAHTRALLVDWMVEIQENFEMNHETLYLGVKLVDTYLSKVKVSKQSLQLVGATSLFIAAKYDERIPPAMEDFIYICDGAYTRKELMKLEVNILRVINFELGFPLSYRFLRRYARCAKVPMPLLTLARFILEYTLMDYSLISLSDSKMAAAALYLAFKMKKEQSWDSTLAYFSGYRVKDFIDVVRKLNNSLHQKQRQSLMTVRNKYSHKIFFEVAKIPLIDNEDL